MNALEITSNIINNENLLEANLKYCLVNSNKVPIRYDGKNACPNKTDDFVDIEKIALVDNLNSYAGLGVSIQSSNICAIDVDHCFEKPFEIESVDERGKRIIDIFKNDAYIEFSFSGTGLRIFFKHKLIENYTDLYYIKNSKNQIEYYQPGESYRYVTITGRTICNNKIAEIQTLDVFLNNYMVRPQNFKNEREINVKQENKSIQELLLITKFHYLKNTKFQDLWFSQAPGYGHDESERDFKLINYIYNYITQDEVKIKELFEESPYYKSKDWMHKNKWSKQDFKYYHYIYEKVRQ